MKTLVIIPSRLSAQRLPGKPLMKIKGLSIISHVFKKAEEANIGEVYVATEDQEIIDDVKQNGGQAVMTSNIHKIFFRKLAIFHSYCYDERSISQESTDWYSKFTYEIYFLGKKFYITFI